ncbi:MAG: DUF4340 domain-containing protein, partial [Planctomycetes bacterium]|nr:DUF4340 domain-containing protein [Planctomycetota bacterium]
MSFKTTLYLAVVLLSLGAFYFITQARLGAVEESVEGSRPYGQSPVSREFLKDKLGDVVKIVCETKKDETWVFQKDTSDEAEARADWRMTSPLDIKVMSWEVQRFASQFNGLMYDISYKPGEFGGVTAGEAGLDPPEATVTLTDADGKTASIEIGKAASTTSTYVRLVGSDEICVGNANLKNLVKSKALDYRDRQAWRFEPSDATRIEIIDRSDGDKPVTFIFARRDAGWMMESPVTAKATAKIDQLVATLSSLRVTSWQDLRNQRLAMYGLEPAVLTVRVTVEEEIEVEEEVEEEVEPDAEAKESEDAQENDDAQEGDSKTTTKTEITTYVLHLSDRSPIGEETKVYLRLGDETVTGTLMKSTADRFKPAMTEWREMGITSVDVRSATRIALTTAQGKATLVKSGARWTFAEDKSRAEESAVTELLNAVAKLTAVVFVEHEDGEPSSFGLDQPQAEVRLSVPGVEEVERIAVGGYTDAKIKRMVYVRRNEARSIGKVRVADVKALLRGPRAYRDRTVIDLVSTRIEQIALSRENRFGTGRIDVTFSRGPDEWAMDAPIAAAIEQERIKQLVRAVADLRAGEIVADEAELTAYGLHAPAVTIAITHKPPIEYKIEKPIDSDHEAKDEPKGESKGEPKDEPEDEPKSEPKDVKPV